MIFAGLPVHRSSAQPAVPAVLPGNTIRVVIDPGHGGTDEGGKGVAGALEKNITLETARTLSQRLAAPVYRTTMTRTKDINVKLVQRAAIANQAEADLLISVHTGGSYVHASNSVTIFFHQPEKRSQPLEKSIKAEHQRDWDQTQSRHLAASKALAMALKQQIEHITDAPACRVQGAPLTVLAGADMPAVLIEIGHLTNPAMETRLTTTQYRKQLAEKIALGILTFWEKQKTVPPDPE